MIEDNLMSMGIVLDVICLIIMLESPIIIKDLSLAYLARRTP
jgi:hypothetical protein